MKNFDFGKFTTKQVFFPSKDGTKVPMFIVHRKVSLLIPGKSDTRRWKGLPGGGKGGTLNSLVWGFNFVVLFFGGALQLIEGIPKKLHSTPPFYWYSPYGKVQSRGGHWPPFYSNGPFLKLEWAVFNIM